MLADPQGSVLAEYVKSGVVGKAGSWVVEGIGEDFVPHSRPPGVTDAYSISTRRALRQCANLKREGILAGSSTGTLLLALRYCRAQTQAKRVVSFVCDTGTRYLSKVYNDQWMVDQGLLMRRSYGDLRDVISRRAEDGNVVSVTPDDTLLTAFQRMRLADVSQLPVLADGVLAGVIDESDVLLKVHADPDHFGVPVADAMTDSPSTLPQAASLEALRDVLDRGLVAIIADAAGFHGLITRVDLINHLRRTLK